MITPICEFDLRSGSLCGRCEQKLSSGQISTLDIEVMRVLVEGEKRFTFLRGCEYLRSRRLSGELMAVMIKCANIDEKGVQQLSSYVAERLKSRVKIVRDEENVNDFITKLVHPARIVSIRRVWLPDGSEELRISVDDVRKMGDAPNIVEEIVGSLKGVNIRIG
ncbi:MAG: hypothetical protein NZ920_04345 [Aigarchaeota archaeon]|nr:hypothetical protein [Aigarchaeota archaeon]MDW8092149.1 hypothetical protein [Nitrososphaerota archaeon]